MCRIGYTGDPYRFCHVEPPARKQHNNRCVHEEKFLDLLFFSFFFWFFIAILNSDTPRATYKPLSTLTVWAELTVSRT